MTPPVETHCPFCRMNGTVWPVCEERYVLGGRPYTCSACGGSFFHRLLPTMSADEYWMSDSVNEDVYTIPDVRRAFAGKYDRYLALIARADVRANGGGKRLLEIGCGSGIFLETAARQGWTVSGVDISPQAVPLAQRFCPGATVICAPVEKAGFAKGSFDLVALWDVIEHVENPEDLLREAHRLLRPGGLLVMETPDEGCLARKLVRAAHRATGGRVSYLRRLYYLDHRWYFSRKAMAIVLRRVGFDEVRFYPERTVKEFGARKATAYGLLRSWPQQVAVSALSAISAIPWFRNKMVVMATKGSLS